MTLIADPIEPTTIFAVESWCDPVIDQLGHDPRSAYVETFWLPILGPSSVWLLRRLADGLDRNPEGFELDLIDTAQSLGVGMRGGRNAPLLRTFERCCRFGAARMHGPTSLMVRRRLAPLTRAQTERLPQSLQARHDVWHHHRASAASLALPSSCRSRCSSMGTCSSPTGRGAHRDAKTAGNQRRRGVNVRASSRSVRTP